MPNSLLTGVSGLLAHQRRLDIVANNLANLNTTAYKSSRGVFADLFYETMQPASSSNGTTIGGTNPNQIGTGVKVAQITKNFAQGNLEATGQLFDFAIDGDGFFVVNDGNNSYYTRAGAFSLDENGYLVDPATGFHVTRFGTLGEGNDPQSNTAFQVAGDSRIRVPIGTNIPGRETSTIDLNGNLESTAENPLPQILTTVAAFAVSGVAATTATLINDIDTNTTDYVAGDTLDITGTNADGSAFATTLAVGPTTTLNDLINEINSTVVGGTASMDSSGNIILTADATGISSLTLTIADATGNTGATNFLAHRMIETQEGSLGETFQGVFDFYDLQGADHSITFEFQKTDNNEWSLNFTMNPAEGSITGGSFQGIMFNDDGSIDLSSITNPATILANINGLATPQPIAVSIDALTQIASEFEIQPVQDGFAPSELVSARVNSDGIMQGVTNNGLLLPLAQLAIAKFSNVNGLSAVGSNYFLSSLNSGDAELGAAATGGRGAIRGGQLEGSNVDVAFEFTQLIVAQRGFSANARTISVADEVLEELTNIVR